VGGPSVRQYNIDISKTASEVFLTFASNKLTSVLQISTRLPIPEEDFQKGQCVKMGFLSEVVISLDQSGLSPFAESIILATICGRALSHSQKTCVERAYSSSMPHQFWNRHE